MKGMLVSHGLEWSVELKGESWAQGEVISGYCQLKFLNFNQGDLDKFGLSIGLIDIKKMQSRDLNSYKVLNQFKLNTLINSQDNLQTFEFNFPLPLNISITDKKQSAYLSFGKESLETHLQLMIKPDKIFDKIIPVLDTFFRFKLKEIKSHKLGVEYVFTPPTSRDYAQLKAMSLILNRREDLSVDFIFEFQLTKLDPSSITTKMIKDKTSLECHLETKDFMMSKDFIDQDKLMKFFESVLSQIRNKFY